MKSRLFFHKWTPSKLKSSMLSHLKRPSLRSWVLIVKILTKIGQKLHRQIKGCLQKMYRGTNILRSNIHFEKCSGAENKIIPIPRLQ